MKPSSKYFELCILIPCYNNLSGLKKSLKSIHYDLDKYLIVIVDDGSDEEITEIKIKENNKDNYQSIAIIRLKENKGIITALNTGLEWIDKNTTCNYIARLDCGDICSPERYYKQIQFLSENTYISLLGSWCYFENPEKKVKFKYVTPVKHTEIENAMHFKNVFIHPTIMLRKSILEKTGYYSHEFPYAEDYDLCWRIVQISQTAILPLFLVTCEVRTEGISFKNRIKQLQNRKVIVKKFGNKFALKWLGVIKISILSKLPYSLIMHVKKLLSF